MIQGHTVAAIIVAAGASTRMGFDKLLFPLNGKTVVEQSVAAFDAHPMIDELIVVTGANADDIAPLLTACKKPCRMVRGGAQRPDSVANGLAATQAEYVAIHDAARPFVTPEIIGEALAAALETGASAPAVPVKDTIKIANKDGAVQETPARETLYAVQTPQCFRTQDYKDILSHTPPDGVTDDCSVFERAGHAVTLTQGAYENYKITTRDDLPAPCAQAAMQNAGRSREQDANHKRKEETAMSLNLRIGHGYDVHKLVTGRALILGGVNIPHETGLLGHSDADVLTHAVMDSLLGAAALGDIGKLFPDTDAAYKGADSLVLLQRVGAVLAEKGYCVQNIDATLLCQAPKLAPHIPVMRQKLAAALALSVEAVSVKATTEEGLGFTGAKEGIAAHSVCLLEKIAAE